MGIDSFKNKQTEELARGLVNKGTRRLLPIELHAIAIIKLQILRSSTKLSDLRNFPGLRLEQLKGDRRDEYSIRINKQYRICFLWEGQNAYNVSVEDYH